MNLEAAKTVVKSLEIGMMQVVTDEGWGNPVRVEMMRDESLRGYQFAFSTHLATKGEYTVYHYMDFPSSWWQHWKRDVLARMLPKRLRHRVTDGLKVETKVSSHTQYDKVCPHLRLPDRKHYEFFAWPDRA